jgi:hypothetical protein
VTPYILPTLNAKIGWIFGSVDAFAVIWAAFFFPELKGRSLEEVDQLFDAHIWAWQFKDFRTTGAAEYLTQVENGEKQRDMEKGMDDVEAAAVPQEGRRDKA